MEIREATERDDDIFVRHCLAEWNSPDWTEDCFNPDAPTRVYQNIQEMHEIYPVGGFLAIECDEVAGSTGYHLNFSPYSPMVRPSYHKLAYIWEVYVEPSYRGQGLGRLLMEHTADYLRSVGCNSIVLHSVPSARGFYEHLGFAPASELRLAL